MRSSAEFSVFTFSSSILKGHGIKWASIPLEIIVGFVIGMTISILIPIGKWGEILAKKVGRPGSFLFKLVMYSVILGIMLIFMCPILTVFMGSVVNGAPVLAVLPASYSLYIPFFVIGLIGSLILGDFLFKLAMMCAHFGEKDHV